MSLLPALRWESHRAGERHLFSFWVLSHRVRKSHLAPSDTPHPASQHPQQVPWSQIPFPSLLFYSTTQRTCSSEHDILWASQQLQICGYELLESGWDRSISPTSPEPGYVLLISFISMALCSQLSNPLDTQRFGRLYVCILHALIQTWS